MYGLELTTHMHPYLHKIPPYSYNIPQHTHIFLHTKILPHTHLYKISPYAHRTLLHTRTMIHTKKLTHRNFNHTRNKFTNKTFCYIQTSPGYITTYTKCRVGKMYPTIHGVQIWICIFATWGHQDIPQLSLYANILCCQTHISRQRNVPTTKGHYLI